MSLQTITDEGTRANDTLMTIVQTAKKVAPGSVANSLYSKYNEAKNEKIKVDEEVENRKKKATEEHNNLML